jgi:hypothetical protein
MKYVLMGFFLVGLISCKNINQTSGPKNVPRDGNAYLSISKKNLSNEIHFKVLNLALREILKDQTELLENEKINPGEELGELKLSKKELDDYRLLRINQAEIVVSFSDHTEIYFAPDGLTKVEALEKLALISESNAKLFWAQNPDERLEKGSVYYLANSNISEILANDLRFHQSEKDLGEIKSNLSMSFTRYQKVYFEIRVTNLQKELAVIETRGRNKACSWEKVESQQCGPCSFKMKRTTGREIEVHNDDSEFIGLMLNNEEILLKDLGIKKLKNGKWEFALDFSKIHSLANSKEIKLELILKKESPNIVLSPGFEYSENCSIRDYVESIDVTPIKHIEVKTKILGRNLEIESVK